MHAPDQARQAQPVVRASGKRQTHARQLLCCHATPTDRIRLHVLVHQLALRVLRATGQGPLGLQSESTWSALALSHPVLTLSGIVYGV